MISRIGITPCVRGQSPPNEGWVQEADLTFATHAVELEVAREVSP